ncbi:MAG: LamG-like jellyroll fold domain-containing protein, partial [Microgenomates group bacterium]
TFSAVKTSTSSIAMYIDGVLAGSDSSLSATATLNTATSTSAYMGIDSDFASNPWAGNLDEFYFYSYARSAAQIKTDSTGNGGAAVLGAQSNDPLMNGLMGYWKMDETTWNGTASEVVDSSGNGNHGTAVNGTITAPTKLGIGGSFDGVNDHISVGSSMPQVSNELTVSSWVTPGDISSHKVILDRYSDRTDGYGLAIYTSQLDFYVMQDSVSKYWRSSAVFAAGQTYHIAVRYKNGEAFGYVNGQPITWSTTPTGVNSSIAAQSGVTYLGSQGGYGNYYYGKLDEFRIYNRALSPAEVQQLYNYAPGPVGHWKMDEKQGLSAFDSSGNGNTGVLTNGPVWANGKFGTGMKYDNVDDLVTISDSNSLDTPAGLTIEGWLNFSSVTASSDNGVFAKWGSGWFVESNYSGNNWRIRVTHSDATYTEIQVDMGTNTANRWYHVAVTYDKSYLKVYRDGILVSSSAATKDLLTNSNPLYIGYSSASGGGAHFFPGTIDDVRMYNYGRSQAQVIQDMNAGHPLAGSPVGSQVAHWKLDEGYGTTANDSSINSNSLTLSSATSAWTNSGKFGKAWNGDGALYMSRADDADFDFTAVEDFAISGWVKSDSASNPGATEYVVNKANATNAGYAVYFNTSGNLCFGIDDDTTWGPDIASCSTADVYDATWHHFSAMRDYSGTLKTFIYVDGISRDSDTDSTSATFANSLSFYVGDRDGTNNGDEFTGDIDEVKIYRGTLTPAEIKIDYNRGQSLVLGSVSNNSTYAPNAANQEYCVPGDATSCVGPVGEWKLDEKSGTTANDTSTSGNAGTLTAGPTWIAGKIGSALNFDGTDDYVTFGDVQNMGTSDFTTSLWFKASSALSSDCSAGGRLFQKRGTGAAGSVAGWSLVVCRSGSDIRITNTIWDDGASHKYFISDSGSPDSAGFVIGQLNQWVHLESVFDNTNDLWKFYANGILVQSFSVSSSIGSVNNARSLTLGAADTSLTQFFGGTIDQVILYNYARSAAQVAWDYNRGAPIAHWRLDECAGTVANDASGNGNTGTITIGASGTNTSAGNCTSGTSSEAWYNGVAGKFNSSLKFDGTDDYVSVADNSSLENAVMSLSAWIYTSAGFPAQTGIIGKRVTSSDFLQYELGISSNTLYWLQSADGGSWATLVSTPSNTISAGWHHYVGTNNGTTARLYIDGKEVGTADSSPATTLASSTETLQIGQSRIGSNDSYFVGQIDDVRIYNYAVTTAQIKSIMNGEFAVRYAPATGQP